MCEKDGFLRDADVKIFLFLKKTSSAEQIWAKFAQHLEASSAKGSILDQTGSQTQRVGHQNENGQVKLLPLEYI